MPLYEFNCKCGCSFEALANYDSKGMQCQQCDGIAARSFSVTKAIRWNPTADPAFDDSRAAHKAWIDSDECQAKIKSGEYSIR